MAIIWWVICCEDILDPFKTPPRRKRFLMNFVIECMSPFATLPAFEHEIVAILPLSSIDPFLRASVAKEFSRGPHFVEKTLLFNTFTV